MGDRYISNAYIVEKWAKLESDMIALMNCAGDRDQVLVKDADRLKYGIKDYMDSIIKEVYGE